MTRIALVHATSLAMAPIAQAFAAGWPEAGLLNLLDDSLSVDRAASAELTPALYRRFQSLAEYARAADADAILFTCSAFGAAIDAARGQVALPMLKPNEAMFAAALAGGSRIGMVATFAPAVEGMRAELMEMAAAAGRDVAFEIRCAEGALAALARGDTAEHDRLVVEAGCELAGCDVIMLAQFSMARAASALQGRVTAAVLSSPGCAVAALRERLQANKLV